MPTCEKTVGTDGKALVAKNGLFGKSIYACAVTPVGLTNRKSQDAPYPVRSMLAIPIT